MALLSGVGILVAGTAGADSRWTPYHDSFSGPKVKAHYVHLVLSIDPEREAAIRRDIKDTYAACRRGKESLLAAGEDPGPLAPPPREGVPDRSKIRDVDVYYSDGQSATIVTESNFRINLKEDGEGSSDERARRADCSLKEHKSKRLYVGRADALCEVDLLSGRYYSKGCPWTERTRADASRMKLPAGGPAPGASFAAQATGEKRRIAGHECTVFDVLNGTFERCFASPASSFAIPASHYAGRQSGLLLQNKWPMVGETLTATDIKLEIDVSKAIFDPPPGALLDSPQRGRRRK